MRQHRATLPAADPRRVDHQERAVRVDVETRVGWVAAGQELLVTVGRAAVMAQPQRRLRRRAERPRGAHGLADLLVLPDDHARAEVVDREGHLRWCPAPVARADHCPDLGRRAEQFIDAEGILAEPQDPVALADPAAAQRVRQPADPLVQLRPGQAIRPVNEGEPVGVAAAVLGDDVPDGGMARGHGRTLLVTRLSAVARFAR